MIVLVYVSVEDGVVMNENRTQKQYRMRACATAHIRCGWWSGYMRVETLMAFRDFGSVVPLYHTKITSPNRSSVASR